jgi:hypothetical protein
MYGPYRRTALLLVRDALTSAPSVMSVEAGMFSLEVQILYYIIIVESDFVVV